MGAMDVNKVFLQGHVANEPEVFYTPNGKTIVSLKVVTNDGYGDNVKANFHNVKLLSKNAEFAQKFIHKGNLVHIEGRIDYDNYKDKKENWVNRTNILCEKIKASKPKDDAQKPQQQQFNNATVAQAQQAYQNTMGADDDDLPF